MHHCTAPISSPASRQWGECAPRGSPGGGARAGPQVGEGWAFSAGPPELAPFLSGDAESDSSAPSGHH